MARKEHSDPAQTVRRIIAATHTVLLREDLDSISFRKVAREAGISPGTLSYYFPSADALWEACLEAHYERVFAFAQRYFAELDSGRSPREILPDAVRAGYHLALRERAMLRLVLALSARRGALSDRLQERRLTTLHGITQRWPAVERRDDLLVCCQTIVYACVRYACSSVEERLAITGKPSEDQADEAIAAHLASAAAALLRV
jgi:AcrR family transcriptional regulator